MNKRMRDQLPEMKEPTVRRAERQPLINRNSQPLLTEQLGDIDRTIDDQHDFSDAGQGRTETHYVALAMGMHDGLTCQT